METELREELWVHIKDKGSGLKVLLHEECYKVAVHLCVVDKSDYTVLNPRYTSH